MHQRRQESSRTLSHSSTCFIQYSIYIICKDSASESRIAKRGLERYAERSLFSQLYCKDTKSCRILGRHPLPNGLQTKQCRLSKIYLVESDKCFHYARLTPVVIPVSGSILSPLSDSSVKTLFSSVASFSFPRKKFSRNILLFKS